MTGIIYCINNFEGMRLLKEIVGDAVLNGCKHTSFVKSKNKTFVEFENGDIWYLLPVSHSARGYRWDYCLIDSNIPQEVIEERILSKARASHWDSPEAQIPIERRVGYF